MSNHKDTIAFTVCPGRSLSWAAALHEAFDRHHPGSRFYVALSEPGSGFGDADLPFTVLTLAELGLPDPEAMAARYDSIELGAAIKPFAFQVIFDRHPGAGVLYLDPGTYVTSRFDELLGLAALGAACVLTPTLIEPAEHAEFDESRLLQRGVFDPGFCYLADGPMVRRVVWWWARRLETFRLIDPEAGLFLDQRWADLFPAFIEGTHVLRHPGYCVSALNTSQRRLRWTEAGWSVNGAPLRCISFGGDGAEDTFMSDHGAHVGQHRLAPMTALRAEFREAVSRHVKRDRAIDQRGRL